MQESLHTFLLFLERLVTEKKLATTRLQKFGSWKDTWWMMIRSRIPYLGKNSVITQHLTLTLIWLQKLIKLIHMLYNICYTYTKFVICRDGSMTAVTSKMESFVITVNGFKPLTVITKLSILDVAAVLDPPMICVHYIYILYLCICIVHCSSSGLSTLVLRVLYLI